MLRILRRLGVSGAAWIAVVAIGGAALAAAVAETTPSVTLSPEGATTGKTLNSAEVFDMTVHVQAEPSASYHLAVTYGGDAIGSCQANEADLGTNEEGKATWTCTFTAAENAGTEDLSGTVTFTVDGVGAVTANLSVRPAASEEEPEETQEEAETSSQNGEDNHGQCVSGWAHKARADGLHGRFYGQFISTVVAQSDCAGFDETEFASELQAALDAQAAAEAEQVESTEESGESGRGHGKGKSEGKGKPGDDEESEGEGS